MCLPSGADTNQHEGQVTPGEAQTWGPRRSMFLHAHIYSAKADSPLTLCRQALGLIKESRPPRRAV